MPGQPGQDLFRRILHDSLIVRLPTCARSNFRTTSAYNSAVRPSSANVFVPSASGDTAISPSLHTPSSAPHAERKPHSGRNDITLRGEEPSETTFGGCPNYTDSTRIPTRRRGLRARPDRPVAAGCARGPSDHRKWGKPAREAEHRSGNGVKTPCYMRHMTLPDGPGRTTLGLVLLRLGGATIWAGVDRQFFLSVVVERGRIAHGCCWFCVDDA